MIRSLAATVLLGLRSRALLTAGSLLLISLAVGSAVLGPIFQVAATNSYLVTRLAEIYLACDTAIAPSGASALDDASMRSVR